MSKILLSIKPEYVEKIFSGEKKYEYRTHIPSKPVNSIVIYSTKPVGLIIGEVEVINIISESPSTLWETTKTESGISRVKYRKYFKDRKKAYAFKLGQVNRFGCGVYLENYGVKRAPQSFIYLNK